MLAHLSCRSDMSISRPMNRGICLLLKLWDPRQRGSPGDPDVGEGSGVAWKLREPIAPHEVMGEGASARSGRPGLRSTWG